MTSNPFKRVMTGVGITALIQSSSATTVMVVSFVNAGLLTLVQAIAVIMGANIGTTITAWMVSLLGFKADISILAVPLMLLGFLLSNSKKDKNKNLGELVVGFSLLFLGLVGRIIETLGYPNPAAAGFAVPLDEPNGSAGTAALYGLSMLHTLFNTINTLILVWFTPLIAKIVTKLIKEPVKKEEAAYRLKYINAGPLATPELATEQAIKEIIHFAEISRNGLGYARAAINETDSGKFEQLRDKLVKYEEISDRIEYEIATFLNAVSAGEISEATKLKIKAMYKIIGELESLGDSGESISRILYRRNSHNKSFDADTIKKLNSMVDVVDDAYKVMITNLQLASEGKLEEISNAYNAEERINNFRNNLREEEINSLEDNRKNYQTSVYFIDVVSELEKMGDFMINISQVLYKSR